VTMDLADARAGQRDELRRRVTAGERIVGLKTALLGSAAQRRLGATEPVWGWLTDAMEVSDGGVVDCTSLSRRKGEVEIVFELAVDLKGPGVGPDNVWDATRALRVGLELPGSVRAAAPVDVAEFVADNTAAAHFVVGPPVTHFRGLDVATLSTQLTRNGEVVGHGSGARVLGDPARAVAWLANALSEAGEYLSAGMLVFSGSTTEACAVEAGQLVGAEIEDLGRLAVTMS